MTKLTSFLRGGKGDQKNWNEHPFDRKPDFQEEFSHAVSNEEVTESYNGFLTNVYAKTYLSMELALPKRGEPYPQFACITKNLCDANGPPFENSSDKPILDTHIYEVEYADSEKSALSANLIAKNISAQIDKEGNLHVLMDKITDHMFDEAAVKSHDAFMTTYSVTKRRSHTMEGVSMCIKWHDRNTTWVALKNIKEAYPFQLASYAVVGKISTEPAFDW